MIVKKEGDRATPSEVAKSIFYHCGIEGYVGDPNFDKFDWGKASERELDLIREQLKAVKLRMTKLLLGK